MLRNLLPKVQDFKVNKNHFSPERFRIFLLLEWPAFSTVSKISNFLMVYQLPAPHFPKRCTLRKISGQYMHVYNVCDNIQVAATSWPKVVKWISSVNQSIRFLRIPLNFSETWTFYIKYYWHKKRSLNYSEKTSCGIA